MADASAHANEDIARLFDRLAGLYEMQEGGGFKARAYRKGAQAIRELPDSLTAMVASGANLQKVPGIGKAIDGKVRELLDTGRVRTYDREAANVSPLALALLDVPGIGGASVRRLLDETGAGSPNDLLAALDAGAGAWLPPTGPRSVEAVRARWPSLLNITLWRPPDDRNPRTQQDGHRERRDGRRGHPAVDCGAAPGRRGRGALARGAPAGDGAVDPARGDPQERPPPLPAPRRGL